MRGTEEIASFVSNWRHFASWPVSIRFPTGGCFAPVAPRLAGNSFHKAQMVEGIVRLVFMSGLVGHSVPSIFLLWQAKRLKYDGTLKFYLSDGGDYGRESRQEKEKRPRADEIAKSTALRRHPKHGSYP